MTVGLSDIISYNKKWDFVHFLQNILILTNTLLIYWYVFPSALFFALRYLWILSSLFYYYHGMVRGVKCKSMYFVTLSYSKYALVRIFFGSSNGNWLISGGLEPVLGHTKKIMYSIELQAIFHEYYNKKHNSYFSPGIPALRATKPV